MTKRPRNLLRRIKQLETPIPMMPALKVRRPTGRRREKKNEVPTR